MYQSFYITEDRLDALKYFIRSFTPSVRFHSEPLKVGHEWFIALTMDVEDGNKLALLRDRWHAEDHPPKVAPPSIWRRFMDVLSIFFNEVRLWKI